MLKRYCKKEMENIWSPEKRYRSWLQVEGAVMAARSALNDIPVSLTYPDACFLINSVKIIPEEIDLIESEITKHDVIAFLMHVSPQFPEQLRPYLHHKMTSYDPQDTGLSLVLVHSIQQLQHRLNCLMDALKQKAFEHKKTVQIGRTHGVHAEPITFGVKLANWYDECSRHTARLKRLELLVAVGKISGAVGMYTLKPEVEKLACEYLGLRPITATQIISRDIIAEYVATLAIIAGSIEKICVNIRTMQRTEILEAQEYFSPTQRGSSAMPHKRNPIGSENLSGMARVMRGYAHTAMENQTTWDERDISNSGPERIFLPDASILLDYMLSRLTGIIDKWIIYPEKMKANLELTKGLIFSQSVQSLVAEKSGLPREEAYGLVHKIAQLCWESKDDFLQALLADKQIMSHISAEELKSCFDLEPKLKHVDYIFESVFWKEAK